jgi:protein phosphatase
VAIVLDPDLKTCTARDSDWSSRDFDPVVPQRATSEIRKSLHGLQRQGFRQVWILPSAAAIDEARVARRPLRTDNRGEHGPFDIIGDVHGCVVELESLLEKLGYKVSWQSGAGERQVCVVSPQGRKLVLVGDLVDRGPRSPDVLRIAMAAVESGAGLVIQGNHDNKLRRWLDGRNVKIGPGLRECINQLSHETDAFKARSKAFLSDLPSHYWLDAGRLTVAHAGLKEEMMGRCSPAERAFALYGQTSGEIDEFGLPVRADWAAGYRGKATVVYGHTPVLEAEWVNNTICIDTGCVFGGKLTALRWPENQLVSVPAARTYFQPVRPLTLRAPPRA